MVPIQSASLSSSQPKPIHTEESPSGELSNCHHNGWVNFHRKLESDACPFSTISEDDENVPHANDPVLFQLEADTVPIELTGEGQVLHSWHLLEDTRMRAVMPSMSSVAHQVRAFNDHGKKAKSRALASDGTICTVCGDSMGPSLPAIHQHARMHFSNPPTPKHRCPNCGLDLVYLHDLASHHLHPTECQALLNDDESWLGIALRNDLISQLRIWESFQLYQTVDMVERKIRNSLLTSSRTYASLPSRYKSATSLWSRRSMLSLRSCLTATRYGEKLSLGALAGGISLISLDHPS